jgi:hypothetical protein
MAMLMEHFKQGSYGQQEIGTASQLSECAGQRFIPILIWLWHSLGPDGHPNDAEIEEHSNQGNEAIVKGQPNEWPTGMRILVGQIQLKQAERVKWKNATYFILQFIFTNLYISVPAFNFADDDEFFIANRV